MEFRLLGHIEARDGDQILVREQARRSRYSRY